MPSAKPLFKSPDVGRLIEALAESMAREMQAAGGTWGIIGIRTGGEVLARRLSGLLRFRFGEMPLGVLDITLYRDDLGAGSLSEGPIVRKTEIDFALDGLSIFLVDDVLYTGRTVRAALDALTDLGRPARVRLAVLVDRGGRELPIQPDHAAERLVVDPPARVVTRFSEVDGEDVVLVETSRGRKKRP